MEQWLFYTDLFWLVSSSWLLIWASISELRNYNSELMNYNSELRNYNSIYLNDFKSCPDLIVIISFFCLFQSWGIILICWNLFHLIGRYTQNSVTNFVMRIYSCISFFLISCSYLGFYKSFSYFCDEKPFKCFILNGSPQ